MRLGAATAGAIVLSACSPKVVEVDKIVKETVEVEKVVKETVEVEKEVTKVVEKVVQAPSQQKEVHNWLGMHQPTEWTTRTAEHPTVVNSTRILASKFEEMNPDISIVWDEGPGGEDTLTWLSAGAAANTSPDLTWASHNWGPQNGWALPIEEYLDQPNPYAADYTTWRDIFFPAYMESLVQPDGREYCAPINAIWPNLEVGLAYNKEVFDDLGLTPPGTWADEMAAAKTLKESGGGFAPWFPEAASGNFWPLALQILPSMMQPILPQMDLNDDKFVGIEECLPAYKSGLWTPSVPIFKRAWEEMFLMASYWIDGFNTTDHDLLWREGKLGLRYVGSWDFSNMANDPNIGFARGFLPPPIPNSSDIPAANGKPGAIDPAKMTAGDGTVPAELVKAVQGSETVAMAGSMKARGNVAETINWWQFLTEPQNNSFMTNENQQRISSCKDAPLGPIWKEIAHFKLPLYDYGVAWWGQGLYWDNENFNTWRKITLSYVLGEMDEATFYARQEQEWAEASVRYEKILEEQQEKS
ncbi:MAG: ABC transporter substrate-binding protein [Anaerolineae bacterium]